MPYTFRRSDIPRLDLDVDRGSHFKAWLDEWSAYADVSGLNDENNATKYNVLRLAFSRETANVVDNLGLSADDRNQTDKIITALKQHVAGSINETVERNNFRKRRQYSQEAFDDFLVSLRELIKTCNYCDQECCNKALRDQIIEGIYDGNTVEELLRQKDLSLNKTIEICRAHESAKQQRSEIKGKCLQINAASKNKTKKYSHHQNRRQDMKEISPSKCMQCGKMPHKNITQCPAYSKRCDKCHKLGHFAAQCRTKAQINNLQMQNDEDQVGTSQLMSIKSVRSETRAPRINLIVKGPNGSAELSVLPDSGADITAADVKTISLLGETVKSIEPSTLSQTQSVDGSTLQPIGQMTVKISLGDTTIDDTLHVFPSIPGGMLISWKTSQELRILPENYPEQMNLISIFSGNQVTKEDLIREFPTVFDGRVRVMNGEKFRIHLKDDARPFCVNAPRTIPYAFRDKVQKELKTLQEQGIIEPITAPTEWCAPIVVAPKKNSDDIRLCVDFSKLNRYVKREFYSMYTPCDAIADICGKQSQFFTVFDALKGYYQCPLDEQSQLLTTFLTPFGRFKFLRAPFGICSISEHYNRRMDEAFEGLNNYRRIVDDIVIFDENVNDHIARVRKFLHRCAELGISINKDKFNFLKTSVTFAGYELSNQGYKIDKSLLKAINDFPLPTCITDLRSFFGLANQLSQNTDKISQCLLPLRPLLSVKNEFVWSREHTQAFEAAKQALFSVPILKFFDMFKPTRLMTDASKKGLGFVLQQKHTDKWHLIQAGSRFLTDTETRYATIEKEMLGIAWAVKKCHKFLAGLAHFDIVTDHNPLLSILNHRRLDEIENPRLQRLRTKLMMYNFTAQWQKGSLHHAPDSLSRHPTSDPNDADMLAEHAMQSPYQIAAIQQQQELSIKLQDVFEAAINDPIYQNLKRVIIEGFPNSKNELTDDLKPFWIMRHDLTLDNDFIVCGCRLLVPTMLRNRVLFNLHESHQGITRTKARARLAVYWPGIDKDIETIIAACKQCQDELPSLPKEPMIVHSSPERPFQHLAVDFAHVNGCNYLIMIDCFTDWPSIQIMHKNTTAQSLISALRNYFSRTAIPDILWSDGGPQFTSHVLDEFLRSWGVEHITSSPGYPQSNGKAEAAVKSMKKLIRRATWNSKADEEQLARALLQYRNTPSRKDDLSPAQTLYGRPVQDTIPVHNRAFAPEWQHNLKKMDCKRTKSIKQSTASYNQRAAPLSDISIGNHVAMQNRDNKNFDIYGVVINIDKFRKYVIKTDDGKTFIRNRRFIRKRVPESLSAHKRIDSTSEEMYAPRLRRKCGPPRRLIEDSNWP